MSKRPKWWEFAGKDAKQEGGNSINHEIEWQGRRTSESVSLSGITFKPKCLSYYYKRYRGYSIMYKTKVTDLGYNRIFYTIEYSHWLQTCLGFERISAKITWNIRQFFCREIYFRWINDTDL